VHLHHQFLDFPRLSADGEEALRHAVGLSLMLHLNLIQVAAGSRWRPMEVRIPARSLPGYHAMPPLSDVRLEFEKSEMGLTFSADVLHLPLPRMAAYKNPVATTWEETGPATDVSGGIQQVVTSLLADGYPDVHLVAEAVRMSTRTLQRRLHEEGLTFARVVARARFDAACRLLADPARKVIDVALDLGYSDPAHFTRAFLRWTGVTPREFRRLRSNDPQQPTA
jgi:AraC-like DNA-binding protein